MNECLCSQSNVNASWPYKFPRTETKINLSQVLVDHKTIEQSKNGKLRITGSDGALPGQIARISDDNTSIEWYTPDSMQADGRTIVKDASGNIGIVGADNASYGQVLSIGHDGNIEWVDQSVYNIDNKTLSVTSNGSMQICGSDIASAMQFLQMQEDGSVKWVTPEYGEMISTINEHLKELQPKISGLTGQIIGFDSFGNAVATDESDPTVPDWAKQPEKPTYTAADVGALPDTTEIPRTADDVNAEPSGAVSLHNTDVDAHNDIRLLIQGLSKRLSAVADSDDATLDQMSEIVAYIKSNKSLIDAITTDKVSVTDIVDNLTTNASNKPLSSAQGVALKALVDAIIVPSALSELSDDATHRTVTDAEKAAWNAKSNFTGSYNDLTDKPVIPTVPVQSVNGKTGAVVLSADDVGALPSSTVIPAPYTLPIASSAQLGGVQPAAKTDAMTQEVGVDEDGGLWTEPGGGGGESDLVEIASVTLSENVAEINLEFPEQNRELFVRTSLHVNDADGTLYKADDIAVDFYVNGLKTFIKTPLTKSSAPGPAIWYMKLIAGCTVGYAYLAWGFTARQSYANDWPRELESFTSIKIKPTGATCEIKKNSKVIVYGRA